MFKRQIAMTTTKTSGKACLKRPQKQLDGRGSDKCRLSVAISALSLSLQDDKVLWKQHNYNTKKMIIVFCTSELSPSRSAFSFLVQ